MILRSAVPPALDPALEHLQRDLAEAQADDPLAPVTVVAPSGYSAVFLRRALAASGAPGRRGWANVTCTTVDALVRRLGTAPLAARGLRPAPPAVDLEAIRTRAAGSKGWLGQFAAHGSALVDLKVALTELRRCPPATRQAIGQRPGPGQDLVALLGEVGDHLRHCGWATSADLRAEAGRAADRQAGAQRRPTPLLTWELGPLDPTERHILDVLGARPSSAPPGARVDPTLTEVRACADPDEEIRAIVRSVIAAAEAGVPLWQQAVFHPPGPTYARILHQQLDQSGVAANGPERGRLHRSLAGRTLLGLLDLAVGDWPRDQVMSWLSSAPITVGPGGPLAPASHWDLVSAAAGVVRTPRQWHERLSRLADGGGPTADRAAELDRFMDDLMTRARPPGESWTALATWATGLLDHYLRPGAGPERWPAAEERAADQIRQLLGTVGQLDQVSDGVDPAVFRSALATELEHAAIDPADGADGGFDDGVFLAPYAGARGLRFDTVAVVGLADALAPGDGGSGAGGLLGDELRSLDASGTLPTRAQRQDRSRGDVLAAVAAGGRVRRATWPRRDPRSGRAQVPSRWLAPWTGPDTGCDAVDSFAAGLAGAGPALSAPEFELRQLDRWARAGGDPARAPAAAGTRLALGFDAARGRIDGRFTRFDGYVGGGRVRAFDPGLPVSATRFETYAKCPRRYLFERVLQVAERIRPEELWRIEPKTRGTLVHAILEDYVAERVAGAPRSLDRLTAIAESRLAEAESGGLVGKALLWRMDRAAILRDLRRFHREEGDAVPIAAELSFGAAGQGDQPAVTVHLGDGRSVAFRGSVDRVDRTGAGQLMVSDYKTGRQGHLADLTRDPVAGGKLLQLPLYALAARDRFGGPGPVHARYWLLSGERSAPCFHLVVNDRVENRFRQVVGQIADGVEGGCFPGVPGTPMYGGFVHCNSCDFNDICPPTRDRQWGRSYTTPELRGVVALVNGDVPDGLVGAVVKKFVDPDAPVTQ